MDTPYPVNTPRVGGFCGSTPTSEAYILSGLRMGHGWCGQTITTIQKPYSIYFINFAFGIHPPPKDGGILPELIVKSANGGCCFSAPILQTGLDTWNSTLDSIYSSNLSDVSSFNKIES